jgi:hypothetical protein
MSYTQTQLTKSAPAKAQLLYFVLVIERDDKHNITTTFLPCASDAEMSELMEKHPDNCLGVHRNGRQSYADLRIDWLKRPPNQYLTIVASREEGRQKGFLPRISPDRQSAEEVAHQLSQSLWQANTPFFALIVPGSQHHEAVDMFLH